MQNFICFWQEEPIKCKFSDFQLFAWKLTKFFVIFQSTSQFSVKFCITFQCYDTWFVSSVLAETLPFGQKKSIKVQIFRFLSALMKVYPIPHARFETTRSMFIQILYQCSVSWKITPLYLYTFDKKSPSSEIFRLSSGWVKIQQILYVMFETTSQFFLNFASLFSVMRYSSSIIF